jgi:hypothetical protein
MNSEANEQDNEVDTTLRNAVAMCLKYVAVKAQAKTDLASEKNTEEQARFLQLVSRMATIIKQDNEKLARDLNTRLSGAGVDRVQGLAFVDQIMLMLKSSISLVTTPISASDTAEGRCSYHGTQCQEKPLSVISWKRSLIWEAENAEIEQDKDRAIHRVSAIVSAATPHYQSRSEPEQKKTRKKKAASDVENMTLEDAFNEPERESSLEVSASSLICCEPLVKLLAMCWWIFSIECYIQAKVIKYCLLDQSSAKKQKTWMSDFCKKGGDIEQIAQQYALVRRQIDRALGVAKAVHA